MREQPEATLSSIRKQAGSETKVLTVFQTRGKIFKINKIIQLCKLNNKETAI